MLRFELLAHGPPLASVRYHTWIRELLVRGNQTLENKYCHSKFKGTER